ncbi:TFIIB-type zinc ribbon-containing protein [Halovulum sp. GXIMD14793]
MTDRIEEHRFPCTQCGSDLTYLPNSFSLKCDHCGSEEPVKGAVLVKPVPPLEEKDFRRAIRTPDDLAEMEATRVLQCPNCGAQVDLVDDKHATSCPFCATPVVTDTGLHRHIKPHGVLPFRLTEEEARDALSRWMGNLWFAPNALTEFARKGRRMQGIYVPYWTYDADTRTSYTGQRGDARYETRTQSVIVNGKRQTRRVQVRHVDWHNVRGRVSRFFNDVLVLGSRSLPKRYTDALEPWDLDRMQPYNPQFLAGFAAEAYQVSLEEGYDEARAIMNMIIERDVRRDIGGDEQRVGRIDTSVDGLTFKHVLLPVWLAAYKFRGKTYRFVVNGSTGAVRGERPWSPIKVAIAVLLFLAVAGTAGYILSQQ